ncbi:delta-60 repeat domain-containing protein [Deinococcus hopiensis]|uniref:delta-60 repeat domain-containing protein n=1 Tax=Deinococcus hopiensis TaxID=309885 RepID=UPI001482C1D0|nr:delta-60 repeat domain-containing protein [Deinococcus hopiensis]
MQTPLPQGDAYAAGVAVQADGKVLIAGRIGNGRGADLLVVRYTTEGRLDPAFGRGGIVVTDLNTSFDSGNTLLLQPDGKIVVGGSTSVPYRPGSNETKSDFALVRYTPDGHLDPSFGQGGAVRTALGTGHDGAYAVALQPDGKLLLTGQTSNGNDDDIGVVRYLPDGRLDVTFGQGGKVVTAIGSRDDVGYGVAVQADGRIVVAGVAAQQSDDVVLVRYTPAGKPDLSFGQGGVVSTDLGGGADGVSSVALQPGGKVLVAGSTWNGQDHDFALLRYTAAGDLDATFGAGGRALTPVGSSQDVGTALVQSQDSIVLVGRTLSGNTYNVGLVQYGVNGVLNAGFGQGGRLTVPVGGSSALVVGALRQADGRLVLAGTSSASGKSSLFLLRLWP